MIQSESPFSDAIAALSKAFSEYGNDWVVNVGVATSLLAVPRYTEDLDALSILDTSKVDSLMAPLYRAAFEPLFSDAVQFSKRSRILPLNHPEINVKVDIAFGCMPFGKRLFSARRSS